MGAGGWERERVRERVRAGVCVGAGGGLVLEGVGLPEGVLLRRQLRHVPPRVPLRQLRPPPPPRVVQPARDLRLPPPAAAASSEPDWVGWRPRQRR